MWSPESMLNLAENMTLISEFECWVKAQIIMIVTFWTPSFRTCQKYRILLSLNHVKLIGISPNVQFYRVDFGSV